MNGLGAVIVGVLGCVFAGLLAYRGRQTPVARRSTLAFVTVFGLVVSMVSIGLYAQLGRFDDWSHQQVDGQVDYLVAAKITKARRAAQKTPNSAAVQLALAHASLEGGRYQEAVQALETCLRLTGPRADLLGLQAQAMYYRDRRQIQAATRQVIERALALDRLDVQTRMLLANEAFHTGRYEEAIGHWTLLLDAHAAPDREQALRNAIANAQRRLALKQIN